MDVPQRSQLTRHPATVAPLLLGAELYGPDGVIIRIVEVEAYGGPGEDPAAHSYGGKTPRNEAMFGPPGSLYAYLSYGIHTCLNIVSHEDGTAGGVLMRAAQVVRHPDTARRGRSHLTSRQLASGPGRLGEAIGYSVSDSGTDLLAADLLKLPQELAPKIKSGPRIGISKATERPWRFWIGDADEVTRYRRGKVPESSVGESA